MSLLHRGKPSRLSSDPARLLAEWGRAFPPPGIEPGATSYETNLLVGRLVQLGPDEMREVVDEIHDIGLREGGWTAYGAWELLNMNYTRDVPQTYLDALSESRVRLIRSLDIAGCPDVLCVDDAIAWKRVFPTESR